MQISKGENQQIKHSSGTYDGVDLFAKIIHGTNDTAILQSDFNLNAVNISVVLVRDGRKEYIMNDNLLLLGTFSTLTKNYHEFVNGLDKVLPAVGVKAVKIRSCYIPFGSPIRVNQGDQLIIEVRTGDDTFSASINQVDSLIDFRLRKSISEYEVGIPKISFEVVNGQKTNQTFNPGDNVAKMMFLNFDKNTLADEVINNLAINSDRFDESYSFDQLQMLHLKNVNDENANRYGANLPISLADPAGRAFKGLPYLPQSILLFNGVEQDKELDEVTVNVAFNGANVAMSQNHLGWLTINATNKQLAEAQNRAQKHIEEKLEKIPTA